MKFVSKHSYTLLFILLLGMGVGASWSFPSLPALIVRNITAIFVAPSVTVIRNVEHITAGVTIKPFQPLMVQGGTMPYTYHITSGVLPNGMQLDSKTGTISGTPHSIGRHQPITITVRDANNAVAATRANLTFVVNAPLFAKANPTVQPLTQGEPIKSFKPLEAFGGTGSHIYSVVKGTLPEGLILDAQTGIISGVPKTTYALSEVIVGVRDVNNVHAGVTSNVTFSMPSKNYAQQVQPRKKVHQIAQKSKKEPLIVRTIAPRERSIVKKIVTPEVINKSSQPIEKSVVVSFVPKNLLLPEWANGVFVMEVKTADLEKAKQMGSSLKTVAQEVRHVAEDAVQNRSVAPIRASNDVMTATDEIIASPAAEKELLRPQTQAIEVQYPSADAHSTQEASIAVNQLSLSSFNAQPLLVDSSSLTVHSAYSLN